MLGTLTERGYVQRLGRRPGQKEDRFAQLLGGAVRVLESEVAALRARLDEVLG